MSKVFILTGWAREEFEATFGVFSNKPSVASVEKLIEAFVKDHSFGDAVDVKNVAQFAVDNIGKSSIVDEGWAGVIIEEHEVIDNV